MSRMGDEMILELAASLNVGMDKTAAKKDEEKEEKKCEKCKCDPCECDKKEDKKKKKDKKKDKKDAVMGVLQGLSKLAADLDEVGADEASSLVDDALKVIVNKIQQEKE